MRQRILGSHTPPCHRRMVITTLFSVFFAAMQRRPVLYHTFWGGGGLENYPWGGGGLESGVWVGVLFFVSHVQVYSIFLLLDCRNALLKWQVCHAMLCSVVVCGGLVRCKVVWCAVL